MDYFRQVYGKEPIKIELPELFYSFGFVQALMGSKFIENVKEIFENEQVMILINLILVSF